MSTTAFHIIRLVKSLPLAEQRAICSTLNRQAAELVEAKRPRFLPRPEGGFHNPEGIPNDDPFFQIMERIEEERHRTAGRPPAEFD